MKETVFTFWEGYIPEYIKMCMKTWKFDYVLLTYDNLNQYTDLKVSENLLKFTLPQIADAIRVHVLRDNGGYWLDTDTIMLGETLPEENMIGDPKLRTNTIGLLHTEVHSSMFEEWARYQDAMISNVDHIRKRWNILGNAFTDIYVKQHTEVTIASVETCWPEVYMIPGGSPRSTKYQRFYFLDHYNLHDLKPTNMLMLHNSWTPEWYKSLLYDEALKRNCTLSNIFREVLT